MTENKRFIIVKSKIVEKGWVINDKYKQFTFPTLVGDERGLIAYCKSLNELNNENKELKVVLKEVLTLLEEEVDLFTDKATEHDINAYIELKELDNKDAYYMATATKKAIKLLKEVVYV